MNKSLHYCNSIQDRNYWAERICKQLAFGQFLCSMEKELSCDPLVEAAHVIASFHQKEQTITRSVVIEAEALLKPYYQSAKSFVVDCVGHAHIDMNWMWGMAETVSIVLDTFRTMLSLMKEYPQFTFSQSQGSTYTIVSEYDPQLLQEIRERVKEGRWEVTASAWTEFDKNMSSGESHLRQYRYASEYITHLLGISSDDLSVGFEPDTFGHNERLPDILSQSHIKYYYHCRGEVSESLYRWRGPAGGEVLVYREPNWYLGPTVTPFDDPSKGTMKVLQMDVSHAVAQLYTSYGIKRVLQVYGVGDHGGGPTRMDIEGLLDMASWMCYPTIAFSSYKRFFEEIETHRSELPIVEGEINRIFPGCYTSQSSIKRGNHEAEKMLCEAELYSAMNLMCTSIQYQFTQKMHKAWQNVLFNQFHDILPGSCTTESKCYAMGLYQESMARAGTVRSSALRNISNAIDTSMIEIPSGKGKRSIGAGVGYAIDRYKESPVGSIEGTKRVITLYNGTSIQREEVVESIVWDWEDKEHDVQIYDSNGNIVDSYMEHEEEVYWQHSAQKVLMYVTIPPFGYASYVIQHSETARQKRELGGGSLRFEKPPSYIFDNGIVFAEFSTDTLQLISLRRKEDDKELLQAPSGFIYKEEDASEGMTAWIVGRSNKGISCSSKITQATFSETPLRQELHYVITQEESHISVNVHLDKGSNSLHIQNTVVWKHIGDKERTPQLSYLLHLNKTSSEVVGDIPFGTCTRRECELHMPYLSWVARSVDSSFVQLIARGKYGFETQQGTLGVILLRSSSDPDPFSEVGTHAQEFYITLYDNSVLKKSLIETSMRVLSDVQQVTHGQHQGWLPLRGTCMSVQGPYVITAMIPAEQENDIEIHGYETEGLGGDVCMTLPSGYVPYRCSVYGEDSEIEYQKGKEGDNWIRFFAKPYGLYAIHLKKG